MEHERRLLRQGISAPRTDPSLGTSDFNEVFFDDVQVPASAMIGDLNNGWLTNVRFAVLNEQLSYIGIDIQSLRGTLATDDPGTLDHGHWQDEFLYANAYTISGGSNQVMQNLLGERALGLPREPKPA